jgi:hypothetical protein
MCSDGIVTEFVLFAKEAHRVIGKPVMTLMRTDGAPHEFASSCYAEIYVCGFCELEVFNAGKHFFSI